MLIVDPLERTVDAFEHTGDGRRFHADESLTSESFPDLHIDLRAVFAVIDFP